MTNYRLPSFMNLFSHTSVLFLRPLRLGSCAIARELVRKFSRERGPGNISSVIIVRAREAFRGNGNNSRFESSTSLSAFDERAHARSLCTRIDLSSRRRLGDGARFRESSEEIVKDQPIISAHRAPLLIFRTASLCMYLCVCVCVCVGARIYVGGLGGGRRLVVKPQPPD